MFSSIVFEGSGFNGLSYVGVIRELENRNAIPDIKNFAGASSGAFMSTMMALGFTSHEIETILKDIKTSEIVNTRYIRQVYNLIRYYGLHKRTKMHTKLAQIFDMKYHANLTFEELHERSGNTLTIVVSDLVHKKAVYINKYNHPNTPIIDILTASLSFPGVFTYDTTTGFIDGGFVDNYPLWIYNDITLLSEEKYNQLRCLPIPSTTLGIKLDEKDNNTINNLFDYVLAIIDTVSDQLELVASANAERQTLHLIGKYDVSLNFTIDFEKFAELIQYGMEETRKFIENYPDSK